MEYMLFICTDPTAPPYVAAEDNIEEWVAELDERGIRSAGNRLRPPENATIVKIRDGKLVIADGSPAGADGNVAGFDVIDCESLEEAVEIAAKHPMARFGKIEVRAFWPFEP